MRKNKIAGAAQTTDRIFAEVAAARRLTDSFYINGYGVLSEPDDVRAAIRSAIKHLAKAQWALWTGSWPTMAEYDADSLARRQAAGEP
jgi:hypothetical protein